MTSVETGRRQTVELPRSFGLSRPVARTQRAGPALAQ